MNRIKNLVALSAFSLLILGLPAIASAQWNGGYGNNGGYYGNGNIKSVVRDLKNKAKRFEDSVDRYDGRNDRYNRNNRGWGGVFGGYGNDRGYNNSNTLEQLADQFKNATDRLEDAYGNGRNLNNSEDEARRVLDIASAIDNEIYNTRGRGGNVQGQWNNMRQNLNAIANEYGFGRNNRRNRNNGGWRNNFPF